MLPSLLRTGFVQEASAGCGACGDAWRRDAQLRAALGAALYGTARRTRLHWACAAGRLPRVLELLDGWGSSIRSEDAEGHTPLHLAARKGHVEVVRELVRRGAVLEARTFKANTPLIFASFSGSVEVARLLLDSGANLEAKGSWGGTALVAASQTGCLGLVRFLLARGAATDVRLSHTGNSPLFVAGNRGHALVVQVLLAAGADVEARDALGNTPLNTASLYGHVEVARLLLDSGADIEAKGNGNTTPLCFASQKGWLKVVQLLIARGANLTGDPLLIFAARLGNASVMRALLSAGASDNARDDGTTALHAAAWHGNTEAVRILIERGAGVNERSKDECGTPLMMACHRGHPGAALQLLGAAGVDVSLLDGRGWSALHYAEQFLAHAKSLCELRREHCRYLVSVLQARTERLEALTPPPPLQQQLPHHLPPDL